MNARASARVDVALDARETGEMSTGVRAYRRALLERLPRVAPDLRFAFVGRGGHFTLDEWVGFPLEVARLRPRLVHYLTAIVPPLHAAPYVVTVQDTVPLRHPGLMRRRLSRLYYATAGALAIRRARRVVVSDERMVSDMRSFFGVTAERCSVVPLAYDPALLDDDARETGERPYLLYAGNHRAHKDLPTLFAAWAALDEALDVDCYVTGADDFGGALARYRRTRGRIVVLGDVDIARLGRLYRGALAYVTPSLLEGFGIPALEAAVVGTPVVGTRDGMPSLLHETATCVAPGDVAAFRAALEPIVRDPEPFRRRAAEVAPRLQAYSCDRLAATMAAVYRASIAETRP